MIYDSINNCSCSGFSGQMYLWGVFRSGVAAADSHASFPDCNYVGSKVPQIGLSSRLAENSNMLPRRQMCTDNSGCSEGEEDMDVDMEGGREIGMAERAAPRPMSQLAHVIVKNASQPSLPSSSKPILSHCENSKSVSPPGSELPPGFDHSPGTSRNIAGKSTEAMHENSGIFRLHKKMEERELAPGFRLPEGKELPNKNLLPGSFSQGWNCMPSTGLESMAFPPGLRPAPVKFLPPYRNFQPVFGPATRNPPHLALNHPPSTQHATLNSAQSSLECPPGFKTTCTQHATWKSAPSSIECPPGFKGTSTEHATSKSAPSSLECPPGFKATFSNQIPISSDHLPGIKPASVRPHPTLSDCRPGFQHSLKHPLSSSECPPGFEPAPVMPPPTPSEHPAGVEHASRNVSFSSSGHYLAAESDSTTPPVSYSEYPPGFEPASGNHSLFSSFRLRGSEPTARKPLMSSIQCPPGFQPTSGNRSLPSSDCPPGFELAADKSLLPSSVHPIKRLASDKLQVTIYNFVGLEF